MSTLTTIQKVRAGLIIDHPFFASLLLPMPMTEDASIPTMATDGESIIFNGKWVESLTREEVLFVLAHETLHCVFDHMGRRGNRGPNRWNQAADYIINDILIKDNIGTMPKGGLHNPSLVVSGGGTAEGVYKLLPVDNEKNGAGQPGGSLDSVNDAGSNNGKQKTDPAKVAEKSAQLKERLIAAKNAAKMQGKLSAGLDRLVSEVLKPNFNWEETLRRFLTEKAKVDFSFARPKRRFLSEDIYLPSLVGNKMGKLVVAVDCSGSVDMKLLNKFASEINAIKQDLLPSSIDVVYFDDRVCRTETIEEEDDVVLRPSGGGGTRFSPVIEYVNNMEETPVCVVFLTDLVCNDFGDAPSYPVLWCVLGKLYGGYDKAPYGEICVVEDRE